jgi:glycogen(starch) synthase
MNVVLVSFEFPPANNTGGIGSYMHHLSVFLSGKGINVTVFSANPAGAELSVVKLPHCVNYVIPSINNNIFRKDVLAVFENFVKTNRVDCIESPEVGACALYLKEKFPHIPLVVKMHTPGVLITRINNTYVPLKTKLRFVAGAFLRGKFDVGYWAKYDKNKLDDLEYKICMMADTLLSPSLALKNWAINFWGFKSQTIKILRNPFSLKDDLFSMPLTGRLNVISFVGKLSVLKGMKAFTEAIPLILRKNKEFKIILVGRDEIENGKSMLEFMQTELAAYKSQIIFTGALDRAKLNEVYASSKVCVFPSLWENYPNVILEAMAAGAAVAAAERGGIPELVKNNITGLSFNALKPRDIASVVNVLLQDERKRFTLAKNAREELIDKMNNDQYEKELLGVYTQYNETAILL